MAETEVESILREIREQVVARERADHSELASVGIRATGGSEGNGASDSGLAQPMAQTSGGYTVTAQNLALINSYLATTARAWDRLPPIVSNRSGTAARFELWLKRQFKRATRWYAWEQVNFNAAVHHSLRDLLPVLSAYQHEITELRTQLARSENSREELANALRDAIRTQSESLQTDIAAQRAAQQVQQHATELIKNQAGHRFAALENELRDRIGTLQEELRVCFKQLSLQTSEAATLEDRARRKTDAQIEELRRHLNKK